MARLGYFAPGGPAGAAAKGNVSSRRRSSFLRLHRQDMLSPGPEIRELEAVE